MFPISDTKTVSHILYLVSKLHKSLTSPNFQDDIEFKQQLNISIPSYKTLIEHSSDILTILLCFFKSLSISKKSKNGSVYL